MTEYNEKGWNLDLYHAGGHHAERIHINEPDLKTAIAEANIILKGTQHWAEAPVIVMADGEDRRPLPVSEALNLGYIGIVSLCSERERG